jgi:nucleolar complex protein 3
LSSDEEDEEATDLEADFSDSDAEMPYETLPRKRRPSWETQADTGIQRLPIKLADGRIEKRGTKSVPLPVPTEESSGSDTDTVEIAKPAVPQREDVATGARFGRPAVVDVVSTRSRKARIQAAKEQIAGICQEIVADPENSVCTLSLK